MATSKKFPTSENGPGVLCTTASGKKYVVTQNQTGQKPKFTLWKETEGGYEKIAGGASSPVPLYEKVPWHDD